MATLAIPKDLPSAESVSCVWMANSRVGATTRVETFEEEFWVGVLIRKLRAGIPNASVFPLQSDQKSV